MPSAENIERKAAELQQALLHSHRIRLSVPGTDGKKYDTILPVNSLKLF